MLTWVKTMKVNTKRNSFLLFLTACIWGLAFVSQSKGMEYMDPFTFNGVRSLIGAGSLLVFILLRAKLAKSSVQKINWKVTLHAGLLCGIALTIASTLQQFGIVYTTVGKAGFITTLYIIFVPMAGVLFGRRASKVVWVAALMAAVGMYLLCMSEDFSVNFGDVLIFICALFFTVHIMIIDHFSPKTDGVVVSCIQFLVCGVLCMTGAFVWGTPTWSQVVSGTGTLLYAGVMSCGVAYTLQIVGQNGVNPTVAALLLSLESVVATVAGVIAFRLGFLGTDQSMTMRQVAGCIIVFTAVILVQLPQEWFQKKNRA